MKHFSQEDYNAITNALDTAFKVFEATSENPEAAMRSFIDSHYFTVWRAMKPGPVDKKETLT